jgi:TetR/AcrR family transcriptional regulator, lmrAB and yxaGH operons repressor
MAADTRARMIDTAIVLLAKDGYQATSFSEVVAASGAPRGSIYHHFPEGKDQLISSALQVQAERVFGRLSALSGRAPDAIVDTFFAWWRRGLVVTDFAVGCSLVAVTTSAGPGALRDETGRLFHEWRAVLARLFADAGVAMQEAEGFAAELLAAAEGAVVIARAEHDLDAFDLVAERLRVSAAALPRTEPAREDTP